MAQPTLGKINLNLGGNDQKKKVKMAEEDESEDSSVNFNDEEDEDMVVDIKENYEMNDEQAENKTASVSQTISNSADKMGNNEVRPPRISLGFKKEQEINAKNINRRMTSGLSGAMSSGNLSSYIDACEAFRRESQTSISYLE